MSCYDVFCKTSEELLLVMQAEEQYLKAGYLNQLDSLLLQKTELFEENQRLLEQVFAVDAWKSLDKSQQQHCNQLMKSVMSMIKHNLHLLDVSGRGNKKLMESCFKKAKTKPAFYTASGKFFETSYAPSVGVGHII